MSNSENLQTIRNPRRDNESYRNEISQAVFDFIKQCTDSDRMSCSEILLDFVGGSAHMASDQVNEMKSVFFNLWVFITEPEINTRFFKMFPDRVSKSTGLYLSQLIRMIMSIDNRFAYAELAQAQLELGVIESSGELDALRNRYCQGA